MHRVFCPDINFESPQVAITDKKEIHHLKTVLRLKKGDTLKLFDGEGTEATGIIASVTNQMVNVQIDSVKRHVKTRSVILACAIPKNVKFDLIVEKCTELGVDEIIPMITQRTILKLTGDRLQKRHQRYQTIAINAAKQCQRSHTPTIHPIMKFNEVIKAVSSAGFRIIPCLSGRRKPLPEILQKARDAEKIVFLIGPEGDFTDSEVQTALTLGYHPVSLGETVLKVDTAAITVCALANSI